MRKEPNHRVDLILLVIVGILIGIQVWLGALPTGVFGHDQFTYLDGAWRVACGQTPHVDFHILYGVLLWKPLQWGLWLSNYDVRGIGFARAFFTAFVVALYLIALRRRPAVLRVALVTFVSVFVATPRPLGEFPTLVSDAMFYNRIGYALVCFVIMDQLYLDRFYRSDTLASGQAFYRGLPPGVAIAALFLIKVSFLLPAGLILLTSALCFRPVVRQVAGVVCGAAATILVALVCLDFRPMAYFADIAMTMRFAGGYIAPRVSQVLVRDWPSLLFVVGAAVLVSMRTARGSRLWI